MQDQSLSKVRSKGHADGVGTRYPDVPRSTDQNASRGADSRADEKPQGIRSIGWRRTDAIEIGETAARHGSELLQQGFTVEQVVHDYGDLCQAITDLAFELGEPIETDEFRTLNRCLDNGIATAVTEYNYRRDFLVAGKQSDLLNERLGSFAHELRNLLNTAMLALTVIKAGNVGVSGATGAILDRSLIGLRHLIDRSLNEVRSTAGVPLQHQLFSLWEFVDELRLSASLEANMKLCTLVVSDVERELALDADRDLLLSVVGNLLQNAFKFTARGTEVSLRAYAVADRILIEVEDRCGGLPPGFAGKMFQPFTQAGHDHSGLGLGLTIAKRGVEANDGTLSVRDIPNVGCIFTINLPRHSLPGAEQEFALNPGGNGTFEIGALSAQAKKLRIIVAEDGISNRKLLEYILERLGLFSAVMVKDGNLAVALSATGAFDVILMDCHMPVMDGYEATKKIRSAEKVQPERKRIHIIGISAAALAHERHGCGHGRLPDEAATTLSTRNRAGACRWSLEAPACRIRNGARPFVERAPARKRTKP